VFGAQAVVAYGVPQLSADVDVTLALMPDAPEAFARDMKKAGFELRIDDPEFVRRTRVMPFVHLATAMPLDIVLAGSGLEDEFLERARMTAIGDVTVPVIDLADLVIAKVLAGRPKDLEDVAALWRAHRDHLDTARIRRTLQAGGSTRSERSRARVRGDCALSAYPTHLTDPPPRPSRASCGGR
jgi:hypothetical protein